MFNLQGTICWNREFSELFQGLYRSRWQLFYYIRSFSVCQELFSFLSNLFRPAPPLSEAAYLLYQTEKHLSRSFFVSFQSFPISPPHLGSSLISILPPLPFVNTFFIFLKLFSACCYTSFLTSPILVNNNKYTTR